MKFKVIITMVTVLVLTGCSSTEIKPTDEDYAVGHTMASCGMGMMRINGQVFTRIEGEVLTNERISPKKRLKAYANYTRCIRKMPKHPTMNYEVLHIMAVCGMGVEQNKGDDKIGFSTRLVSRVFATNAFSPEEKAEAYGYYTDCHEVMAKWINPENSLPF